MNVMESTPEKKQTTNPISKFEDSPVFNYINSLSPIKPVKYVGIARTLNSLSFTSLPSVFTSPHLNSQKEPRLLRRHDLSDLRKPDFSSDEQTEGNRILDVARESECSADAQKGFIDHMDFGREDTVDLSNGNSELPFELPQTLKYDSGSPDTTTLPISPHVVENNSMPEISGTEAALYHFVKETSVERRYLFNNGEAELQGKFQPEEAREERMGCSSENLTSDAADLLIFDLSTELEASKEDIQALVDQEASCFNNSFLSEVTQDRIDDFSTKEPIPCFRSCEKPEERDLRSQVVGFNGYRGDGNNKQKLSNMFLIKQDFDDPREKAGNRIPLGCKQEGGLRRRCLVFEMAGTHKRKFEDDGTSSSISFPSNGEFHSDDEKPACTNPEIGHSSSRMLPGIGLHLNTLAVSSKDCGIMKNESLASGNQLVAIPSSADSFCSLKSEQVPVSKCLAVDGGTGIDATKVNVEQDDSPVAFETNEELNQSTKKKRRKLEHTEESGTCKRCNCKKSRCLKLYCECFAAGLYCVEPCSCKDCFNKPIHEDAVLATRKQIESRNPLAFAPKVIIGSEYGAEIGEESNKTPASARHKRGCNCKKSSCLKKYCECFQGGVGCSINCRCEGCRNTYGRKDGTEEAEPDDQEETENCEKFNEEIIPATDKAQNDGDKNSDGVLPAAPSLQICRQTVQVLFSSMGKPPQSLLLSVDSSPKLNTNQMPKSSDSLEPQPKFGKHFQIMSEGETPDILKENYSPIRTVKIASPNGKRVSPPHHNKDSGEPPPRQRPPTRKLILQSIPSSLSYNHRNADLR